MRGMDVYGGVVLLIIAFTIVYAIYNKYTLSHIRVIDVCSTNCHILIAHGLYKHHEYLERKPCTFNFDNIDYYWNPVDVDGDEYQLSIPGKQGMSKIVLTVNFNQVNTQTHGKFISQT